MEGLSCFCSICDAWEKENTFSDVGQQKNGINHSLLNGPECKKKENVTPSAARNVDPSAIMLS